MKEIEILVEVYNKKEDVVNILNKFEHTGDKRTLDIYYYDPLRADLKPDETDKIYKCFRLRDKAGKIYMTYKDDVYDENGMWQYSNENEIEISNMEQGIGIVESLGLKELVRIDNHKHTYTTDKYEIVYEEVDGLGNFIEVEAYVENDDVNETEEKEKIREFLKELNLNIGEELNSGKPELLIKKNNIKV